MNAKTLRALRASIAHHKRLLAGKKGEKMGPDSCALCRLFLDEDCEGCPVSKKTEKPYCYGTPYPDSSSAWEDLDEAIYACDHSREMDALATFKGAEQREIAFLESLLPKRKKR